MPTEYVIHLALEDQHTFHCFQGSSLKGFSNSFIDPRRKEEAFLSGDFELMFAKKLGYTDVKQLETNQAECLID